MNKKIKFITNTAFLLNVWFKKEDTLFIKVRKWLSIKHNEHWDKKNIGMVEVTLKMVKEKAK